MFWNLIDRVQMGWWSLGRLRWVLAVMGVIALSALGLLIGIRSSGMPASAPPRAASPAASSAQSTNPGECASLEQKLRNLDARFPKPTSRPFFAVTEVRGLSARAVTACPTPQEQFVKNVLLRGWFLGG